METQSGVELSIDVIDSIPEGCDFIYGAGLFIFTYVHLGISRKEDKLTTNMKIYPMKMSHVEDDESILWLILQILIATCILCCIFVCCGYSVYWFKYKKGQQNTYSGGLDYSANQYANGGMLDGSFG